MSKELSEGMIVTLFITEVEDLELIQSNIDNLSIGSILGVAPDETCKDCFNVQLYVESIAQLYLLGRYVGCDRKRIFDKDF